MKRTMFTRPIATLTLSLTMCMTAAPLSTAMAQDGSGFFSTTTMGLTTSAGVLTTVGVVWLVMPKKKAERALLHYMNENRASLEEGLIIQQGDAIHDLAAMSGIGAAHHDRFAQALSQEVERRGALLLDGGDYSEDHAAILLECMRAAVEQDATLMKEMTQNT